MFVTYWIAACVAIHAFAMQCKAGEHSDSAISDDPFIAQGLSLSSDSDQQPTVFCRTHPALQRVANAKACQEQLKQASLWAKERRRQQRAQQEGLDLDDDDDNEGSCSGMELDP